VQFGRSRAEAEAWVMNSDEINAALIETTRIVPTGFFAGTEGSGVS
jgi:hypothetical protein